MLESAQAARSRRRQVPPGTRRTRASQPFRGPRNPDETIQATVSAFGPEVAQKRRQRPLRGRRQEAVVGHDVPDRARGEDVGHQLDGAGVVAHDGKGAVGWRRERGGPVGVVEQRAEADAVLVGAHAGDGVDHGAQDAVAPRVAAARVPRWPRGSAAARSGAARRRRSRTPRGPALQTRMKPAKRLPLELGRTLTGLYSTIAYRRSQYSRYRGPASLLQARWSACRRPVAWARALEEVGEARGRASPAEGPAPAKARGST